MLALSTPTITEPATVDHFLLRELRKDWVPTSCLWTSESTTVGAGTVGNVATNIAAIGIGAGTGSKGPSRVAATHPSKKTLRVCGLTGEKNIVVELLSDKQSKVRPASGVRVWVHRLVNPENVLPGHSEMTPEWPPIEVSVAGAVGATSVNYLKGLLCRAVNAHTVPTATAATGTGTGASTSTGTSTSTGIVSATGPSSAGKVTSLLTAEKASMYKFSSNNFNWTELKPGMLAAMKSKNNAASTATASGESSHY